MKAVLTFLGGVIALYFTMMVWRVLRRRAQRKRAAGTFEHEMPWNRPRPDPSPAPPRKLYSVKKRQWP